MEKKIYNYSWFRGMLFGLFVPTIMIVLFFIMNDSLRAVLVIPIALLELPVVIIGRACKLPIETGGAAFIMCDFTTLGYSLTIVFWSLAGIVFGLIGDIQERFK